MTMAVCPQPDLANGCCYGRYSPPSAPQTLVAIGGSSRAHTPTRRGCSIRIGGRGWLAPRQLGSVPGLARQRRGEVTKAEGPHLRVQVKLNPGVPCSGCSCSSSGQPLLLLADGSMPRLPGAHPLTMVCNEIHIRIRIQIQILLALALSSALGWL